MPRLFAVAMTTLTPPLPFGAGRYHSRSRGEGLEDGVLLLLRGLRRLRLHRQPPSHQGPQIHAAVQNHAQRVSSARRAHVRLRAPPGGGTHSLFFRDFFQTRGRPGPHQRKARSALRWQTGISIQVQRATRCRVFGFFFKSLTLLKSMFFYVEHA